MPKFLCEIAVVFTHHSPPSPHSSSLLILLERMVSLVKSSEVAWLSVEALIFLSRFYL